MSALRKFLLKQFEEECLSVGMPWETSDPHGLMIVTVYRDGVSAAMPTQKLWEKYSDLKKQAPEE